MEEGSFWHWFWYVAMDGIGGGLFGGVIAWLLLRRTIGHEEEGRAQQRRDADESELRASVLRIQSHLKRLLVEINRQPLDVERAIDTHAGLWHSLAEAESLAEKNFPEFSADMGMFRDALVELGLSDDGDFDSDALSVLMTRLTPRLYVWVGSTSTATLQRLTRADLERLIAERKARD